MTLLEGRLPGRRKFDRRLHMLRGGLVAVALLAPLAATAPAQAAATHVDNPYSGATRYVNPHWAANVEATAENTGDPALAAKMRTVATYPTAVWMDRIAAVTGSDGSPGLTGYLDEAVAQQQGVSPQLIEIVIYDLPGRDCAALASNGELPATDAGLTTYKQSYIDPIATILSDPRYANLRIVTIIEPDSLPNIVTNMSMQTCATAAPYYEAGIVYALNKLHALPNVYTYLDIAHSGWLGWPNNAGGAVTEFAKVANATTAGKASIDGFISNTANYTPVSEPYMTATQQVGGQPVQAANFYQWNPDIDEVDYASDMYSRLVAAGLPSSIGMLIDTSRNGWGGTARPTGPSTSTDLNTFVNASKIDRRPHRGGWCNQNGAGLGERPVATPGDFPSAHLDAYVWIKPPGESDGISDPTAPRFDAMCDPNARNRYDSTVGTNALPGAPQAGQWFAAQFTQLVQNAYPPVPTSVGGDTQAPTVPGNLAVTGTTDTTVALSWSASSDNVGVTAYDVYRGSTAATTVTGSPPATSATVSGLSPATSYSFTVRARDAAGNTSAASSAVSATTRQAATVSDCTRWGTTVLQGGEYLYQQNEWNSTATQCASIDPAAGAWSITQASFSLGTAGPPATYPSSYKGCHWGVCTTNSGLPIQVSRLASATSSWNTTQVSAGAYNAAYDIWFNSTPTTTGQPDGTELMIWLNSRGGVQPFGSQTGTANLAGMSWNVWTGQQTGWKIITYVLQGGATSFTNFNVKALIDDSVARGSINPAHYLIDAEAGFEIWQGGQGLGVTSFSFNATQSTGDTSAPTVPGNLAVTGTTDTSVSLSWSASSDNVGVTAYDVYRGGALATTVTGSPPATNATVAGLSPSTTYSFTVRARDVAGNTSAASNTVNATTQPAPPPSGGVKARYRNYDSPVPQDNQIKPGLSVVNTASTGLTLSTVTIRYWFTGDPGATTYGVWCDYALIGCGNLTYRVMTLASPRAGADRYLEVGFTPGAGTLAAGGWTGDAQLRMSKTDWSAFNETNDYSWSGTQTGYGDWTKVTVYINGTLAWGTEP